MLNAPIFLVLINLLLALAQATARSVDWCWLLCGLIIAFVMFEISVPKMRLIDEVLFAGFALAGIRTVALCGLALSPRSVALLNEFLLITITFEFSLLPFFKSYKFTS